MGPAEETDADRIAKYRECQPFVAQSGTYEVKGSTVIMRPILARNTQVMASKHAHLHEFKIQGDTLWLTPTNALGERVRNATTFRLTRVE
jgi:hypothetical protein